MPKKLLVICGPTAVGKTRLALKLAKKFGGELVSADSRQVYTGMDIGTGKDRGDGTVKIWGYDLADPKESFSVFQYRNEVAKIIKNIFLRNNLPILVGGTGLYLKAITDGIETIDVPPDFELRKELSSREAQELFEKLIKIDPKRASELNDSDKKNPRRLIRSIEIACQTPKTQQKEVGKHEMLFIGLTAPKEVLKDKIITKVKKRINKGIEDEIRTLLKENVSWDDQSMSSLGYRQWKEYFDPPAGGKKTKAEAIKDWTIGEIKYSKRQMVWFKKDKRINWFDISDPKYLRNVVKMVEKWYYK